ncbi:hypothetical protein, partial [Pseudoduganella sp. RAF53_2]|uniref:hypothetical protein n=1 Tax=Pseudoduganella sp. RAF53_2 TaxID=3233060 RepID=UPI003F9DE489
CGPDCVIYAVPGRNFGRRAADCLQRGCIAGFKLASMPMLLLVWCFAEGKVSEFGDSNPRSENAISSLLPLPNSNDT